MFTEVETVLDHGYVKLLNLAGPTRRRFDDYDAHDIDPANSARMSFDQRDAGRSIDDDLKLCRYLYEHRHTTPFEMIEVWMEMQMPIFVARQFVRHRTVSINEVSARYTKLDPLWYVPISNEAVGIKSSTNKQGRDRQPLTPEQAKQCQDFRGALDYFSDESYQRYEQAIADGIPNELARCFLPLNIYTKWLWNQDLHNMLHLLRLRLDSHAQYEIQEYAWAMHRLLKRHLPNTMELFEKELEND